MPCGLPSSSAYQIPLYSLSPLNLSATKNLFTSACDSDSTSFRCSSYVEDNRFQSYPTTEYPIIFLLLFQCSIPSSICTIRSLSSNSVSTQIHSEMSSNLSWTPRQNKAFEDALATYNHDMPDWWQNLAKAVGGKSVEEVKWHYQKLVQDINHIESGKVPVPNYRDIAQVREQRYSSKYYS